MGKVGKRTSLSLVLAVAAIGAVLPASAGAAWSGEITRAEATAGGTQASVAGTVEWTGCEHWVRWEPSPWELGFLGDYHELLEILEPPQFGEPSQFQYCGWLPYVTVGPGSELADCESHDRDLFSLGAEVGLAWEGEASTRRQQIFVEVQSFDETEAPLSDPDNRLVCLSVIEVAPKFAAIVCIQVVGALCPPFRMAKFRHEVASAILTGVEPEEPEIEEHPRGCAIARQHASPRGKPCRHGRHRHRRHGRRSHR